MRLTLVGALMVGLLATGCVSGKKAFSAASLRSGCKSKQIEVIKQDGHDLVLNVCGVYEDWNWHAFNGWQYVGPSANQPAPPDSDGDGVNDDVDACPQLAGPAGMDLRTNGCPPPPDSDGDGIADNADACVGIVGVANADPKKNGCPPDGDDDGVVDAQDACVDRAGVANADPKKNGCPPDGDDDGIADADDACADKAGVASTNPKKNGCPADTDDDGIIDEKDACPEAAGILTEDEATSGCPDGKAPEPKPADEAPDTPEEPEG